MKTLFRIAMVVAINALALYVASRYVPGISYTGDWQSLAMAGVVIGLVNLIVKPIVKLLALPLIIVTLGLFYLVINGLLLEVASWMIAGLTIDGCLPAIVGGTLIAFANWLVGAFLHGDRD